MLSETQCRQNGVVGPKSGNYEKRLFLSIFEWVKAAMDILQKVLQSSEPEHPVGGVGVNPPRVGALFGGFGRFVGFGMWSDGD